MRDRDDRARVGREVVFEPLDALGVEVVGRLVEQQQVVALEQRLAQRDAAALAAGERATSASAGGPHGVHRQFERASRL